jgi:hypothetical protein
MVRHETSKVLMDWTEDMLSGRNLIVHHGDITTEGNQIEAANKEEFCPHFCGAPS